MPEDLTSAAKGGDLDAVKSCIEEGGISVDSRFPKQEGPTALYWACCNGFSEIGTYLVNNGADSNIVLPKSGSTPLHAASDRGHYSCVRLLLNSGSRINQQTTNNHDTPLHLAAYRGHSTVCSLLLDRGADITILNKQDRTALDEAYIQEHQQVIGILSLKHLEIYRSLKVEIPKIESVTTSQDFEDRIGIHPFSSVHKKNNKNNKQTKNNKNGKQNKSIKNEKNIINEKNNKNENNLKYQSNYSFFPNILPPSQTPKPQFSTHLPLPHHHFKSSSSPSSPQPFKSSSSSPQNQLFFERSPEIELKQTLSTKKCRCGQNVDDDDYDGDDDDDNDNVKIKDKVNKNKRHLSDNNLENNKFPGTSTRQFNLTYATNPVISIHSPITPTSPTTSSGPHPTFTSDPSRKKLFEKIEDLERLVKDLMDAIESKDVKFTALKQEYEVLKKELINKNL